MWTEGVLLVLTHCHLSICWYWFVCSIRSFFWNIFEPYHLVFNPNSPKSPVLWLKWYADCSWSGDFCASERVQWCTIHVFWRSEIADHLMGHWFILHSNFWSLIGLKHPHWNGSKVYTLGSSNLAIEHPLWYVCVYIYIYIYTHLVGGLEHECYVSIDWECQSIPTVTHSIIFQRGSAKNHQPDNFCFSQTLDT